MRNLLLLTTLLFATACAAQQQFNQEGAIRSILDEEVTSWNKADANHYSRHFAEDGTFTNILGMHFTGHQAFVDRHDEIFKGMFRGTVLKQDVVSIRFLLPDVAIVETITWITGFPAAGPPPGTHLDGKGRLRTRLLQVMTKDKGDWKIALYHNVDIKPTVSAPEPK
jgi:uncharacterized protein (TIGR02246 family)